MNTFEMTIYEKLLNIQTELKSPKGQYNKFGNYAYRNCEDILEAVKPLLSKYKVTLVLSDELVVLGEHSPILYKESIYDTKSKTMKEETRVTGGQRYYVKSTATLYDVEKEGKVDSLAYAREDETKKGMDLSQLTGSTSSYARKYALNGLFAIDDTKDSDSINTHGKDDTKSNTEPQTPKTDTISEPQQKRLFAISKGNTELVKEVLDQRRLTSTKEIKKTDYEGICKYIEARVNG